MLVKIGKSIEIDVDANKLPANVMQHVVYIGLRNILMDAHAGITEEKHPGQVTEVSRAVAEKKLSAMYAGEVRAIAERETDPVRATALDIAERKARAEWKQTAGKEDKFDNPRKRAAEYLEKHPEIMEAAEAIMA
jgi:hypothetical protein